MLARNRVFKQTSQSGHTLEGNALKVMFVSFRMPIKQECKNRTQTFKVSASTKSLF
ncbi:hypothetical protein HanIR_Chr02g0059211 [Helianthus annuus]|nr:hypothetical protein HanIR_Chr02g0059211 [Helianthus annuus]